MESETKFVELIIVNDRSQVSLAGSNKRTLKMGTGNSLMFALENWDLGY